MTVGAHRLWAHRSYKASTGLRFTLMIFQTLAGVVCILIDNSLLLIAVFFIAEAW